jgi:hypothetical protein
MTGASALARSSKDGRRGFAPAKDLQVVTEMA